MKNTKINIQQKSDDFDIEPDLKKVEGHKSVATPEGQCSNEIQIERTYPKHGTQAARLLAALLFDQPLTHTFAFNRLGISRLAAVVGQLRHKYGWCVENPGKWVTSRFGERSKIGLYELNIKDIDWAKLDAWKYFKAEYELMQSLEENAYIVRGG